MNSVYKSKWRYTWVLPISALILTSIPKFLTMDFVAQNMEATGMEFPLIFLGIVELLCTIIFLIPQTRNIGFLLLTAYIGGMIAVGWGASSLNPVTGIVFEILLWVGMYFENPALFKIYSSKLS